jgi:hypothetical protein
MRDFRHRVYCFTASATIVLSISSEFKVAVFIWHLLNWILLGFVTAYADRR